MQILIPVTLVSTPESRSFKTISNFRVSETLSDKNHICSMKQVFSDTHDSKQISNIHSKTKYKKKLACIQPQCMAVYQQVIPYKNKQNHPNHFDLQKQKCQQEELQKKSTKFSLHGNEKSDQQNFMKHEESAAHIVYQKLSFKTKKSPDNRQTLQTEGDILPELIYSCKICLQSTDEQTYNSIDNPICKVCKCKDFVHLKCLQEWISHRDILNQEIHPDQCEICLAIYDIQMQIQSFVSSQLLLKNLKYQPYALLCKFLPTFGFLSLSIFTIYLLITLIINSDSDGGRVRQILQMPYGTTITIIVFLLLIALLVFGILLYTWMMDYAVDFEYKIKVVNGQKSQTHKLKKIFNRLH